MATPHSAANEEEYSFYKFIFGIAMRMVGKPVDDLTITIGIKQGKHLVDGGKNKASAIIGL